MRCALVSRGQSIARVTKNLRAQHFPRAQIQSPENVHFGGSTSTSITFSFVDQSLPTFLLNVRWVVVDQLRFRFSIRGSIPEIFAIKAESCLKSRKIWDDFLALLIFLERAFQKLYPVYHSYLAARQLKKFHEDTPTSPEVIEHDMLNFRPNLKFSRLKFFFGGGPSASSPLGVCASKPWSVSSAFKNLRGQHPLMAEM